MASDSKTTVMVVEHTVFFKFRDGYTEEQEMDMYMQVSLVIEGLFPKHNVYVLRLRSS
ncbi:unnamed protein product [Calypogeia fissa]